MKIFLLILILANIGLLGYLKIIPKCIHYINIYIHFPSPGEMNGILDHIQCRLGDYCGC